MIRNMKKVESLNVAKGHVVFRIFYMPGCRARKRRLVAAAKANPNVRGAWPELQKFTDLDGDLWVIYRVREGQHAGKWANRPITWSQAWDYLNSPAEAKSSANRCGAELQDFIERVQKVLNS